MKSGGKNRSIKMLDNKKIKIHDDEEGWLEFTEASEHVPALLAFLKENGVEPAPTEQVSWGSGSEGSVNVPVPQSVGREKLQVLLDQWCRRP
jgi:hypothetical protein